MSRAADERLRQERETFDLAKRHADRWFGLRLWTGYLALGVLEVVAAVCVYVALNPGTYSSGQVGWAMGVLGGDILCQAGLILKVVMSPGAMTKLAPVTMPVHGSIPGRRSRRRRLQSR